MNHNSNFNIYAVELEYYHHDDIQILIPHVFGAESRKKAVVSTKSGRRRWDEASFFADAEEKLGIESKAAYAAEYDEMVLEEIINTSEIKYPPQMLDHEKNDLRMDMENRLAQQGISMDIYLQIRGLTEDQLEEELLPVAEKRLKQSLILFEIASEEDLKVDPSTIEEEATRTFNAYASSLPPKEARKLKSENVLPSIYTNLMVDALARTSMDWLRSSAKGELEEPEVQDYLGPQLTKRIDVEDQFEIGLEYQCRLYYKVQACPNIETDGPECSEHDIQDLGDAGCERSAPSRDYVQDESSRIGPGLEAYLDLHSQFV